MKKRLLDILPPLLLMFGFFALWELLVKALNIPSYILPTPSEVLRSLYINFPLYYANGLVTLEEILLGTAIALFVALVLAFSIFEVRIIEKSLYPLIVASQTIPVFAIAPLLILWLGYGMASKVLMTALIVFFPIVVNTVDGLKSADEDQVNLLRIMNASELQILKMVRIPSAIPHILSGLRVGVAVSPIGAVIGEWVGSNSGLGYLMIHANAQLRVEIIFASIFVLSVIAYTLFLLVELLEKLLLPWKFVEEEIAEYQ